MSISKKPLVTVVDFLGRPSVLRPVVQERVGSVKYPKNVLVCLPTGEVANISLRGKVVIRNDKGFTVHLKYSSIDIREDTVRLYNTVSGMPRYITTLTDGLHTIISEKYIRTIPNKITLIVNELKNG